MMRVCPKCGTKTELLACPRDGASTVGVAPEAATYAPGTVIADRYEVQQVLGIGGFGAVYRCKQLSMDKQVAVKVLRKEHIRSDEHVKRFAFEARIASKLTHPHTIQIFDFGANPTDSALYLVMEFLKGETLAQRLDREHRISAEETLQILKPVCYSLAEAHEKGLIHRDLKPENLMLTDVAGDPNHVKVLDFGIAARLAESEDQQEKLTEAGMIMGTPTYMSPEQAHGKPLDARSDIYALGVLMYEMLTGDVPFDGDQPMNVLLKHISEVPVPPCEAAPSAQIPKALEKLVLQCLEKEPLLRPQNCIELADMLKQVEAQPEGVLRRGKPKDVGDDVQVTVPVASPLEVQTPRRSATRGGFVSGAAAGGQTSMWRGLAMLVLVGLIAVVVTVALVPSKPPIEVPDPGQTPAKSPPSSEVSARTAEKSDAAPSGSKPGPGNRQVQAPAQVPALVTAPGAPVQPAVPSQAPPKPRPSSVRPKPAAPRPVVKVAPKVAPAQPKVAAVERPRREPAAKTAPAAPPKRPATIAPKKPEPGTQNIDRDEFRLGDGL